MPASPVAQDRATMAAARLVSTPAFPVQTRVRQSAATRIAELTDSSPARHRSTTTLAIAAVVSTTSKALAPTVMAIVAVAMSNRAATRRGKTAIVALRHRHGPTHNRAAIEALIPATTTARPAKAIVLAEAVVPTTPIAITKRQWISNAGTTKRSAAIFRVSLTPRAKLTRPALAKCATTIIRCKLKFRNLPA